MTENLESWELLKELCAVHAVSGREDRMIRWLRDHLEGKLDDFHVDRLGNITGIIAGEDDGERQLLLQAHMDELGLIVRDITEDGFLRFERVGGVPEKSLLGQRVDILTEDDQIYPGLVGPKSHHVTGKDEKFVVPKVHDMFVDVGLRDRDAVQRAGIRVGDPITYHPNYFEFGDGLICSKALDNRVSVFVLLQVIDRLIQKPPKCTVAFAFTVLEEFSIRGSLPAVQRIRPHAILSLDITIATDTPAETRLHPVRLGEGPAIKMMDFHGRGTLGGMFTSPPMRRMLLAKAGELGIDLQREVITGVITDPAFQLYLGEEGQTIAGISIPQRYTHASVSTCHQTDILKTVELTATFAQDFDASIDLERG